MLRVAIVGLHPPDVVRRSDSLCIREGDPMSTTAVRETQFQRRALAGTAIFLIVCCAFYARAGAESSEVPATPGGAVVKVARTLLADLSTRKARPQYPFSGKDGLEYSLASARVAFVGRYDYSGMTFGSSTNASGALDNSSSIPPATLYRLVVDGKESAEYDKVRTAEPIFSPDGKRTALVGQVHRTLGFWASMRNEPWPAQGLGPWVCVVDGKAGAQYAEIVDGPRFSPDSKRLAYVAIKQGKAGARLNPLRKNTGQATATRADKSVVVVDGRVGREYDEVRGLCFSPDSKHAAYAGRTGDRWAVVVDNKPSGEYDLIGDGPFFSSDGKHTMFTAKIGSQWHLYTDGSQGKPFDQITASPLGWDGSRTCYGATRAGVCYFIDGGAEQPTTYESIASVILSPDSKRVAYVGRRDGRTYLVLDGHESEAGNAVGQIAFSTDSAHTLRTERQGEAWLVLVDGKVMSPAMDRLYDAVFSPDSAHVAYTCNIQGSDRAFVDAQEIANHAAFVDIRTSSPATTSVAFNGSGAAVCIAREGDRLYLITAVTQ